MTVRVLIVDDDRSFRRAAGLVLTGLGMEVVGEARDAASALAAAARVRPDAVLLDVQLPDSDGFAVARALRGATSSPRIVLTSSDATIAPRAAVAGCGAVAFVPKVQLALSDLRAHYSA